MLSPLLSSSIPVAELVGFCIGKLESLQLDPDYQVRDDKQCKLE